MDSCAKLSISPGLEHTLQLITILPANPVHFFNEEYSPYFRKSIKGSSRSQAQSSHTHNV
jgi:hypothetical protein